MSRTIRYYNKKNRIKDFYHPWRQLCCGHCRSHKDWMISKRRRLAYKEDLRLRLSWFKMDKSRDDEIIDDGPVVSPKFLDMLNYDFDYYLYF